MTRPRPARAPKTYSLETSPTDFRHRIFDGSQYVAVYEPHELARAEKELARLTKPRTRKAAAPAAPAAVEAAYALELAAPVPVVARAASESLLGAVTAAPSPYASAAQAPRPAAQFGRAEDFRTPHIKEFGQYGTESHGYKVWNPLAARGQGAYVGKDLYTPFANIAEASDYLVEVRLRMQEAGKSLSARDRRHLEKDHLARATVGTFFAKPQPGVMSATAVATAAKQRTLFNGPRRTFPNAAPKYGTPPADTTRVEFERVDDNRAWVADHVATLHGLRQPVMRVVDTHGREHFFSQGGFDQGGAGDYVRVGRRLYLVEAQTRDPKWWTLAHPSALTITRLPGLAGWGGVPVFAPAERAKPFELHWIVRAPGEPPRAVMTVEDRQGRRHWFPRDLWVAKAPVGRWVQTPDGAWYAAAAPDPSTWTKLPRRPAQIAAVAGLRQPFKIVEGDLGPVAHVEAVDDADALRQYYGEETQGGRSVPPGFHLAHYVARPGVTWEVRAIEAEEARMRAHAASKPRGRRTHANPPLSHFLPPPRGFDASEHRSRERDREVRDRDVRDPDARRVPPPYAALPNPFRRPRRRRARRTR